jgi:NAD(P)-dependent dehydrogenase (short-subunit alcohol dehydrogenase family)
MSERWVLVTGGALRLGREFCLAFARAGWNVICHYRHSADAAQQTCAELRALGRQAHALQADLAHTDAAARLFDDVLATIGRTPDALVNNASQFEPDSDPDTHLTPELLTGLLQLNLAVPLQLAGLLASARAARGQGGDACAIHVLDQKVFNLNPDYFSYTVTKLALERAVALQAQALAPRVRVVGLAPGLMYLSGPQTPENFAGASQLNLLARPIDPVRVAQAGVFLASNDAITGTTLSVDNGQHLVPLACDVMFLPPPPPTAGEAP